MYTFTKDGKTVSIFPCVGSGIPIIYLNTFSNEGHKIFEAAQAADCPPFSLVAISDLDWNRDMAPWDSPAAFKKGEAFTGRADNYLQLLVEKIIPRRRKRTARTSYMARNCRLLSGWTVFRILHLSDRCVLPGGMYVRVSVVSRFQRIHLFSRAKAPAGLHILLPGRQRGQNP